MRQFQGKYDHDIVIERKNKNKHDTVIFWGIILGIYALGFFTGLVVGLLF